LSLPACVSLQTQHICLYVKSHVVAAGEACVGRSALGRSSRKPCARDLSGTPRYLISRLLRSRTQPRRLGSCYKSPQPALTHHPLGSSWRATRGCVWDLPDKTRSPGGVQDGIYRRCCSWNWTHCISND